MSKLPTARLLIPSPALGACIFVGVERDTRGLLLTDAARFNFYPATPMVTISWIFEGVLHLIAEPAPNTRPGLSAALPHLIFSGPQHRPTASWSPGVVHALSVAFYPDALARLLGQSIEPFIDQSVPLEQVATKGIMQACEALFASPGDSDRFQLFEDQFLRLWQEPSLGSSAPIVSDWIRSLATRAAHSSAGKNIRQFQRRIKHWTGQSQRDLQLFTRVEEAFVRSIEQRRQSSLDLADLAFDAGFSDQSHMGREIKRVTGFPPGRFDECLAKDEAFWFYRLLEGHIREGKAQKRPDMSRNFLIL